MTGTFLRVWEWDSMICVLPEHEPSIDGAVGHYLETGRDRLLRLTTISGEEYVTRASAVTSWLMTTAEGRMKGAEVEKAAIEEEREIRVAAGLPWEDAV